MPTKIQAKGADAPQEKSGVSANRQVDPEAMMNLRGITSGTIHRPG